MATSAVNKVTNAIHQRNWISYEGDDWFWTTPGSQPTNFVDGEARKDLVAKWITYNPKIKIMGYREVGDTIKEIAVKMVMTEGTPCFKITMDELSEKERAGKLIAWLAKPISWFMDQLGLNTEEVWGHS
ncbi:hypothetical protein K469DRAFT_752101 [Zopfia rhizophila CBS 207.26]|uniref:Uncharacterized protein n=1 Tax=Zopfia rhizophila CBS 207.26 TaxID=1314779 RepID=A0A6A6DUA2_9PEZI|nr:hypothetical protein K469DRAFT_752101 [Zopfia rhizophila CBS 207.26]